MEQLGDMRDSVEEVLKRMGEDPGDVDAKTLRQLIAIQKAVDEEVARISAARKAAAHGMPIVRVAELSGIARQTIYNKPLLMRYSEAAIEKSGIEKRRRETERLEKTVAEQRETIAKLVRRDPWEQPRRV